MTAHNATELVVLCENALGWVPDSSMPLWKARSIQAGRLKTAVAKDPRKLTWHNLELAVELLRRERQTISSPMFVIYKVDEALRLAQAPVSRPIGELIDAAIGREMAAPTERGSYWVGRFSRAVGKARLEVHAEWFAERGAA